MDKLDMDDLTRLMDKVRVKVFQGSNAAFLGSLMCSLEFHWTTQIETAATDGIHLYWNPHWFLELPFETRKTVMIHELWHVAMLHGLRIQKRDPEEWNIACDIWINNTLKSQGYTFVNTHPWLDPDMEEKSAEQIYDIRMAKKQQQPQQGAGQPPPPLHGGQGGSGQPMPGNGKSGPDPKAPAGGWGKQGKGDLIIQKGTPSAADTYKAVSKVVQAHNSARMAKQAGDLPGELESVLKTFLEPKLPWATLLYNFFNEMGEPDYSWSRPNRRYLPQDMYLPGMVETSDALDHLIYYLDVSGSVTDEQVIRFNSEVKYVKETFMPKKMTLVQFDTKIQGEKVFQQDDPFDELVVVGRGGTHLECVRQHMMKHKPTAAIIFSDMYCAPMNDIPRAKEIPTIWIAIDNQAATVPFGRLIHLSED